MSSSETASTTKVNTDDNSETHAASPSNDKHKTQESTEQTVWEVPESLKGTISQRMLDAHNRAQAKIRKQRDDAKAREDSGYLSQAVPPTEEQKKRWQERMEFEEIRSDALQEQLGGAVDFNENTVAALDAKVAELMDEQPDDDVGDDVDNDIDDDFGDDEHQPVSVLDFQT